MAKADINMALASRIGARDARKVPALVYVLNPSGMGFKLVEGQPHTLDRVAMPI
jgi:hypothetical protein